jgi:hypothetical protein
MLSSRIKNEYIILSETFALVLLAFLTFAVAFSFAEEKKKSDELRNHLSLHMAVNQELREEIARLKPVK